MIVELIFDTINMEHYSVEGFKADMSGVIGGDMLDLHDVSVDISVEDSQCMFTCTIPSNYTEEYGQERALDLAVISIYDADRSLHKILRSYVTDNVINA